jgi:hypothetical protein
MLTNQTRATLVQLLRAVSPEAVRLLLIKHLDHDPSSMTTTDLLDITAAAGPEQMAGLLVELLNDRTAVRADAPTKYVFDGRLADLRRRLRADGFEVVDDVLTRLLPVAEPLARISDHLDQALAASNLDNDGSIRRLLQESHASVSAVPPDFNDGTTKARIALETLARRSASAVAASRGEPAPTDTWGAALAFLRAEAVITQPEEEALAKVYTLISPGAHVPKGLTDEQWALLARTFALSGSYFLTRQHIAA